MVGNMVHLIFRHELNRNELTLMSLHATFDGAQSRMTGEAEYWHDVGAKVDRDTKGGFMVEFGQNKWYFFVSSRTIDK